MGLVGDRAERHGAGREALDDLLRRFDFIQRYRLVGEAQLEQAAQRQQALVLLVDECREFPERLWVVAAGGVLQPGNRVRGPHVVLAAHAEGIVTADIELVAIDRGVAVGVAVPAHGLGGHRVDARRRAPFVAVAAEVVRPQ